jgi:hypothetical protein
VTEETVLGGSVENGRQGHAVFTFYRGPVGIRERDDRLEVAFFADKVSARIGTEGIVDSKIVTVIGVTTRELDQGAPRKPKSGALKLFVATVLPVANQ